MDYSKLCSRSHPINFRNHLTYGIYHTATQQSCEKHLMFIQYLVKSLEEGEGFVNLGCFMLSA